MQVCHPHSRPLLRCARLPTLPSEEGTTKMVLNVLKLELAQAKARIWPWLSYVYQLRLTWVCFIVFIFFITLPCRANMGHVRQSRPDSGRGFQVKYVLNRWKLFPLRSEAKVYTQVYSQPRNIYECVYMYVYMNTCIYVYSIPWRSLYTGGVLAVTLCGTCICIYVYICIYSIRCICSNCVRVVSLVVTVWGTGSACPTQTQPRWRWYTAAVSVVTVCGNYLW